jgi:hypothetical protein
MKQALGIKLLSARQIFGDSGPARAAQEFLKRLPLRRLVALAYGRRVHVLRQPIGDIAGQALASLCCLNARPSRYVLGERNRDILHESFSQN